MIAYLITNLINGKQYVGITTRSLKERFRKHATNQHCSGRLIHKAIKKYGVENFTVEQIASAIKSVNNLKELEIQLIEQYETFLKGYNLTKGGDGSFGLKQSPERAAQSRKNALGNKSRLGQKQSDEERLKKSLATKGIPKKAGHGEAVRLGREMKRQNVVKYFAFGFRGIF